MTTPEGKVKRRVKDLLKQYEVYWFMPVQTGYGAPSLDFLCCHRGRYLAIETKAPGKRPTPRQEQTMKQIELAGGRTFVIDGDENDMKDLEIWLEELDSGTS